MKPLILGQVPSPELWAGTACGPGPEGPPVEPESCPQACRARPRGPEAQSAGSGPRAARLKTPVSGGNSKALYTATQEWFSDD